MSSPKITFSILCYNYGRYLEQAILSCLDECSDDPKCEILVINDGSTDITEQVCAKFSDQIRVINEGNKGFASSLNRAIQFAYGDFVFLLDADDYFIRGKLSAFLPHLLNGKLFVHDRSIPIYACNSNPEPILMGGGSTSTIAVNRKAAMDILPVENEIFFHLLKEMGHGVVIDYAFTVYRVHDKSMTNRKEPGKQNTYLAGITHRLADKIEDFLSKREHPLWFLPKHSSKEVANYFRAQAYYNELEAALECKKRLNALNACINMMRYAFASKKWFDIFYLKMIIKTLIGRPSFEKSLNR